MSNYRPQPGRSVLSDFFRRFDYVKAKVPVFVQLVTVGDHLHGLDEEGRVWIYLTAGDIADQLEKAGLTEDMAPSYGKPQDAAGWYALQYSNRAWDYTSVTEKTGTDG